MFGYVCDCVCMHVRQTWLPVRTVPPSRVRLPGGRTSSTPSWDGGGGACWDPAWVGSCLARDTRGGACTGADGVVGAGRGCPRSGFWAWPGCWGCGGPWGPSGWCVPGGARGLEAGLPLPSPEDMTPPPEERFFWVGFGYCPHQSCSATSGPPGAGPARKSATPEGGLDGPEVFPRPGAGSL